MESELAYLIKVVGRSEIEIERARYTLQTLASGQSHQLFDLIDSSYGGLITANEISSFLSKWNVTATQDEINAIVNYYDLHRKGGLNLEDFKHAITPRQNNIVIRRVEGEEAEPALVKFFTKELDLLRKTQALRHELVDSKDWSLFDCYRHIDIHGTGSFVNADLDEFLQHNHVVISTTDVTAAFNRLDKENKQKVTFSDFQNNLFYEPAQEKLSVKLNAQKAHRLSSLAVHTADTPTFSQAGRASHVQKTSSHHSSPVAVKEAHSPKAELSPPKTEVAKNATTISPKNSIYYPTHYSSPSSYVPITSRPYTSVLNTGSGSKYSLGYTGYSKSSKFNFDRTSSPIRNYNPPALHLPSSPLFEIGAGSSYAQYKSTPVRTYEPVSYSTVTHVSYRPRYY